jgi:DNA processing protein
LKDEHLAALLTLQDLNRADVRELRVAIAHATEERVVKLLDEAIATVRGVELATTADKQRDLLVSQLTPARLGKRLELLNDYRRFGIRVMDIWDESYPRPLKDIADPPPVLLAEGRVFPGEKRIAIVGTRQASPRGQGAARTFAYEIASKGWTIVSGLARGIDTAAHLGALDARGTTLGILAGDLGHVFPPENAELFASVRASGSIVSEVTPLVPVHRGRFIERNRITSGLSEAVVIAEFHGSGGTLQQARFAIAQRRPLFSITPREAAEATAIRGHMELMKMGATAVSSPEEVLEALSSLGREPSSVAFK